MHNFFFFFFFFFFFEGLYFLRKLYLKNLNKKTFVLEKPLFLFLILRFFKHCTNTHADRHKPHQTIPHNKILNITPPEISKTEQALPHYTRRLLAQLITNKSAILHEYLHKITPETRTTQNCPLCHTQTHILLRRYGTILGGGGAAGPLVGPAEVGSGAEMRGGGISKPLRGRQQQQWKKYTSTLADKTLIQNEP